VPLANPLRGLAAFALDRRQREGDLFDLDLPQQPHDGGIRRGARRPCPLLALVGRQPAAAGGAGGDVKDERSLPGAEASQGRSVQVALRLSSPPDHHVSRVPRGAHRRP
jgi:hypothetical protein